MNALIEVPNRSGVRALLANFLYDDPLDVDGPVDRTISVTRRCLTRLALIAAKAGACFQHEDEGQGPSTRVSESRNAQVYAGVMAEPARLVAGASIRVSWLP